MILYSDVIKHVYAGKRVLYACFNQDHALRVMHDLMEVGAGHGLTWNKSGRRIDHPSGGYVYFASQDHQVIGLEFDRAEGAPTERMLMRVRPKDANNG